MINSMQKGFAPILIVLGIIVLVTIAAGAYYLGKSSSSQPLINVPSPTLTPSSAQPSTSKSSGNASDTASWKIVKSVTYPISFEYPSSWQYMKNANNSKLQLPYTKMFSEQNETVTDGKGCALHIGMGGGGGPDLEVTDEPVVIDGKSFTKRSWLDKGNPVFVSYLAEKSIPNFELLWVWITDDNCQKTIDQILSTFKFTN